MKPTVLAVIAGLSSGCVGAFGVLLGQRLLMPEPVMVSVRVNDLIASHIAATSKELDDPTKQAVAAGLYSRALDSELDALADQYGAVIFSGGAVIRGAMDLTDVVRAGTEARLAADGPTARRELP